MLGLRPFAQPPLVGGRQVELAGQVVAGCGLNHQLCVLEVDSRNRGGDAGQVDPQERHRLSRSRPDRFHHAGQHGAQRGLDVAVVLDEAKLDVEGHVFGEVACRVMRFGSGRRISNGGATSGRATTSSTGSCSSTRPAPAWT